VNDIAVVAGERLAGALSEAVRTQLRAAGSIQAACGIAALLLFAACAPLGACGATTTGAPSPSLRPSATAALTFDPSSVDFLDQIRGPGSSGRSVVVLITNSGTAASVTLGSISVQPAGYVAISNDGCSSQTLAPGATCSVELSYPAVNAPAGAFVGRLSVTDDLPPDRVAILSLKGHLEQM